MGIWLPQMRIAREFGYRDVRERFESMIILVFHAIRSIFSSSQAVQEAGYIRWMLRSHNTHRKFQEL